MKDLIFGRTWDDIQVMQQGGQARKIDFGPAPEATAGDRKLLNEHGAAGLTQKGMFGVIDRLRTSGLM